VNQLDLKYKYVNITKCKKLLKKREPLNTNKGIEVCDKMVKEEVVQKVKDVVILEDKQLPNVEEVPLSAHERETGYKAIVDKTTMDTICVVPNDNQIVQHNHVLKEVNKLDNYIIQKTTLLKNGTKMLIELVEREPKKIELLPNDFLECGARIYNDYTKNRGLSVQGCGTRLICSNGVTSLVKTEKMEIFAYGTADFSKELETRISKCIAVWSDVSDIMERANNTTVSIKDVMTELPKLSKKYMDTIIDELEDQDTVYNIWNQYTRIITHEIAPKVRTAKHLALQKRANKILKLVEVQHE